MIKVSKVAERAKRLLGAKEKFLVLEMAPAGSSALFLSVDEDRGIIFEKFLPHIDLKKFLKSPVRKVTQKSWEGQYLFKSRRKMIVAADASLATTIPIPLELKRERGVWKDEITLAELENLIAQAMAKIFNQCRSEASKRLGIDELHTILVSAKTAHIKVDGRAVMNPAGFAGKNISLLLELTFTSRDIFEDLKQFFSAPDDFFFIEAPQARLFSLARVRSLPLNLILAGAGDGGRGNGEAGGIGDRATLFVLQKTKDGHAVLYRERLDWSFESIFRQVAVELGVSSEAARELYGEYCAGKLSEGAARAFKKVVQPAVDAFLNAIDRAKISGLAYMDASHALPFAFPHKHKGVTFDVLPTAEILSELDLDVDLDPANGAPPMVFRYVAPFLEAYFSKSISEINQKLRRRLHWLAE